MPQTGIKFENEQLNRLFPFYILMNSNLQVISCGKSLGKIYKNAAGLSFAEEFIIKRPSLENYAYSDLIDLNKQLVVLELKDPNRTALRGQFEVFKDSGQVLFVGSPWYGSMEQVRDANLNINDFAFHDPLIDLLHVLKSLEITNEESKQLIKTINLQKNNLKKISKEIQDIALFPMQNPDPLFRIGEDGSILVKNPAAEQINDFLYKEKYLTNEEFWAVVAASHEEPGGRWVVEANSGGRTYSFVCKHLPEQKYINVYGRDVTEEKSRQQELQRLSAVVSANERAIVITDLQGKIIWANNEFSTLSGYSKEEATGKTPIELFSGPLTEKDTVNTIIEKFLKRESNELELVHYRKDGTWFWGRSRVQPLKNLEGKVFQYFAMIEDVTQQRKDQEQLKVLSSIVEDNINAVIITDRFTRIIWTNKSFTRATGYTLEEVKGKKPGQILQGKDTSEETTRYLRQQIGKGMPFNAEILNYKKNGESYWLRIQGQPIYNDKNELTGFFAIEEDITLEKEINKKIRESEELFIGALDKIGDNIWEHDFRTGKTKFSRTSLDFLAMDIEENAEKLWWDCVHPGDQEMLISNDKKYRSGEIDFHSLEYRMINAKGQIKWVLDRGVVVEKDQAGMPVRIVGTHTDITHIKQTEAELENRIKQFNSLAANLPGVIYEFEFRPDGTEGFKYVSPSIEKVFGIRPQDMDKFALLIPVEDLEMMMAKNKHSRKTLEPYYTESRMITPDGKTYWHSASSTFTYISDDGTIVFTGYMQDITAKKNAEDALKSNEEKYRGIIANMNLGLLEVDNEDVITFANQSFSAMSGLAVEDLIGKSPRSLLFSKSSKELMGKKNDLRNKGVSDVYEIEIQTKNGDKKWWLISGAPRYDDKGQLVGSIGIHLDITEQKMLEYELIKSREIAEKLARTKENFLANMSHEIRTPMNAIMGMSSQLTKTVLNPQQRFYLDTIHSAADNLLVILNDILDLSKIEAGKLSLENIGFQILPTITRAINVLAHKAEEKGILLSNSFIDDKISKVLIGDPYRLNQVLLNFISNSIKFTDRGYVDVKLDLVKNEQSTQTIRFSIKDTGSGMDQQFVDQLFDKFSQESDSIARKFGGTGLGMSICKELIDLMGGSIAVSSRKGEGTLISFDISFRKGSTDDLPANIISTSKGNVKNKTILVVDDNDMNRLVASTVLKYHGATVLEAISGEECIEQITTNAIDLVLMDIQMPGMNGMETTRVIRDMNYGLPIIAMTANAFKGESEKCIEAGMNDYLSKPFKEEELITLISGWIEGKVDSRPQEPYAKEPDSEILYDLTTIKSISRGNDVFVKKMVRLFCAQAPAIMTDMFHAYRNGDHGLMGSLAHKIKPSIDNMNITGLKKIVRDIESSGKENNNSPELEEHLNMMQSTLIRVIKDLELKYPQ